LIKKIQYANKPSDIIAIKDGTYVFKDKKEIAENCMKEKLRRESNLKEVLPA
jgi:hypothetical protein